MSNPCCTNAARQVRRSAPWLVPTAVLLLMPKCPMCLAAYVMAATGMSISFTTAGWLRIGLIAASIALLLALSMGVIRRRPRGSGRACAGTSHLPASTAWEDRATADATS